MRSRSDLSGRPGYSPQAVTLAKELLRRRLADDLARELEEAKRKKD